MENSGRSDGVRALLSDVAEGGQCRTMQTTAENEKNNRQCSYSFLNRAKRCHQWFFQYLFSRIMCLSILFIITFLLGLIQEFTYISKFRTFSQTSNSDLEIVPRTFLRREETPSATNTWRRVTDGVYVYSAYWDDRQGHEPLIKIVGGTNLRNGNFSKLKCLTRNRTSRFFEYDEAKVSYRVLIENHSKPSVAVYMMCIPKNGHPPDEVSVVPESWNSSWTTVTYWLDVIDHSIFKHTTDIAVCVRPLFNYSNTFRISEFIAFYETLGVDRFTFYDYTSSPVVGRLVQELRVRNYVIELLPWNLPDEIRDMWCLGQIASINDCILHHRASSAFVLVVDLDEFVTPRHVETLDQLISTHDVPGKNFSIFVFRSSVFCGEYESDTLPDVIPNFVTQSRLRRETKIYPFLVRSKYVVRPRSVIAAGIHFVWELVKGAEQRYLPASQVLVHHYRTGLCENNSISEIDPMARKYLNRLMRSNAVAVWNDLFKGWYLDDISMKKRSGH